MSPPAERNPIRDIRACLQRDDAAGAAARFSELDAARMREHLDLARRIARSLGKAGDSRAQADFLEACLGQLPQLASRRAWLALEAEGRSGSAARLALTLLQQGELSSVREVRQAAQLAVMQGLLPDLPAAYAIALASGCGGERLALEYAAELGKEGRFDEALALLDDCQPENETEAQRTKRGALRFKLLATGDPARAREAFRELAGPVRDSLPLALRRAYDDSIQDASRPVIESEDGNFILEKAGDRCVIVFGGIVRHRQLEQLDALRDIFRAHRVSLLMVNDRRRNLALAGVGDWYPSRSDTVAGIREFLAAQGLARCATFGSSGAGLPALAYGAELQADGVLTFSGVSYLPDERDVNVARALSPLRRVTARLPAGTYDARPVLERAPGVVVHAYYPEGSPFDVEQAGNLRGLPGVTALPLPTDQHGVVDWLQERGELRLVVERFFGALGWV